MGQKKTNEGQSELFAGASVSKISDGQVMASLSAFAREFGIDRETLRRRLQSAGVAPAGERSGHNVYRLRDVFAAWTIAPEGGIDPEALPSFQRRAWYQGEHSRLQLEVARRELVPVLEVEQEQAAMLKIVAEGLDGLPDVVERDCGATAAQLERLERACDEIRERMYHELAERGKPDSEPVQTSAHDAVAAGAEPPPAALSATEQAAAWLQKALKSGARPVPELEAEAGEAGVSKASLKRAKKALGVSSRREGKGWIWESIPE